ncbi:MULTISPECIES: DUF6783 domain-containing protein [Blautia]|uniref:DUF6783 domain-containing protein n=1 Tax=Blautia TaxID=572511 RepID=UPI003A8578B5
MFIDEYNNGACLKTIPAKCDAHLAENLFQTRSRACFIYRVQMPHKASAQFFPQSSFFQGSRSDIWLS